MRETVAEFRRRTGSSYEPPEFVTKTARPLAEDEPCPTLFRFPGPCGVLEQLAGSVTRLGPMPDGELWAADHPVNTEARGAAHFGTLAILEPLRFAFGRRPEPGIFLGANRPVDDAEGVAWVPPSALAAPVPWDRLRTAGEVHAILAGHARERDAVLASLERYLEELLEVARVGIDAPEVRWCDRPEEERLRLLAENGLVARWSGVTATRTHP